MPTLPPLQHTPLSLQIRDPQEDYGCRYGALQKLAYVTTCLPAALSAKLRNGLAFCIILAHLFAYFPLPSSTLYSVFRHGAIRYRNEASFYGWIGQTAAVPGSLQHTLPGMTQPHCLSIIINRKAELLRVLQTFLQPRDKVPV